MQSQYIYHVHLYKHMHQGNSLPGSLILRAHDACSVFTSLLTMHWYIPEWSTVVPVIVRLLPWNIIPFPSLSISPLKYHVMVGSGTPENKQVCITLSPLNCSKSSAGYSVILTLSVDGIIHVKHYFATKGMHGCCEVHTLNSEGCSFCETGSTKHLQLT